MEEQGGSAAAAVAALDILNYVYPVGSIYMSVNNVSPASFIGGTWVTFAPARMLMGRGNIEANTTDWSGSISAGDLGILDAEEKGGTIIHSHEYGMQYGGFYSEMVFAENGALDVGVLNYATDGTYTTSTETYTGTTVSSATMNGSTTGTSTTNSTALYKHVGNSKYNYTIPPYVCVYMWKRTA